MRDMNDHGAWAGTGNTLGTSLSIVLLFIAKFSVSDMAAIFAILAAGSTAALNLYKFIQMRKNKNDG